MRILKNNILLIIGIIFLVALSIMGLKEYDSTYKFLKNEHNKMVSKCEKTEILNESYCREVLNDKGPVKLDAYNLTFYIINYTVFSYFLPLIPLIIIAVSIEKIYKYMKSGIFRNMIMIDGYKSNIFKLLKHTFKYSLIIPFIIIFIFIISATYSQNFNLGTTYIPDMFFNKAIILVIFYIINLFLNSIFWIGLGVLCAKKSRNYLVTVLGSYIIYLLYSVIMEISSGLIFTKIKFLQDLNIYSYIKPGNIWGYDGVNSILSMTIYSLCLVMVIFIIIYKKYNKKESVIIANEF